MFSRIEERFGTAGLIVAVVALVAALGGSAYAAKGALTSKQKKEVTKIAKQYAGKPGAPGAAGPPGSAGSAGKDGTNGIDGTNGKDGANGKSVAVDGTAPGCAEDGITVQVQGEPATAQEVCNGEEGVPGEPGDPWTAGGTLPAGETETGSWAFGTMQQSDISVPISFFLPLPVELTVTPTEQVHAVTGAVPAECSVGGVNGSAANPLADPGHLCVYVGSITNAAFKSGFLQFPIYKSGNASINGGASKAGAVLRFESLAAGVSSGNGTFAVTAPNP